MPELPEVETIARALREGGRGGASIIGRNISHAESLWDRSIAEPAAEDFIRRVSGQQVEDVGRRGKYLIIMLNDDTLLIHLRMSGDLRVESIRNEQGGYEEPLQKHDRVVINFSDGLRLVFNDPRKFGRVWLTASPQVLLAGLGFEPLEDSLTTDVLYDLMQSSRRRVKSLLMDQKILAGLGNIYTDEVLFLAGVHPKRAANSLTEGEVDGLLLSIRQVLSAGIQRNGASIDWVYRGGDFQNYFRVYQRTGEECVNCGAKIERCIVAQRGSHFCPICQPYHTGDAAE